MRFGQNLNSIVIPEWKACYLDYEHLKIFVMLLKAIVEMNEEIEKSIKEEEQDAEALVAMRETHGVMQRPSDFKSQYEPFFKKISQFSEELNEMFYEAHREEMNLHRNFIQLKILQIRAQFNKLQKINEIPLLKQEKQILLTLVEYNYIETTYMESMKEINKEGQRKILKKHVKYMKKKLPTPPPIINKVNRLSVCIKKFSDDIEDLYVEVSDEPSKQSRQYLRNIAKKSQYETTDSFIFGSWVGICLSVLIVLLTILLYQDKHVETDSEFERDFPTWRGMAFFIFYLWILAMNTYMFQKYGVSHRIIFNHDDHHYSTAMDMFKLAGFFTSLFFILFLIYVLSLAEIATLSEVGKHYLDLFIWGAFILYLILPLPILNWRGRLFGWKMFLISVISPFIGVTFPVIWLTDQVVSLVTPFQDFAYTICYYTILDLYPANPEEYENPCSASTRVEIVFVVGAVAYSYRIIQCMRQGYDHGQYLGTPPFFNTLKYTSSLITLTLSFFWKAGQDSIFAAWLSFAILSTIYSYIWDLKMDWGLLEKDSKNKFLRDNLTYQKNMYYIIMIVNLVFRLAWVATLSPSIVQSFGGSKHLFTLLTGSLEILRRGFWNLFRVEKEHLINFKNFQAIPNEQVIEDKLYKMIEENKPDKAQFETLSTVKEEDERYQNELNENFLPLIRQLISKEEKKKEKRARRAKKIKQDFKKLKEDFQKSKLEKKKNQ